MSEERTRGGEGSSGETGAGSSDWELFLLRLRYREGRLVPIAGNKPILLDDPEIAWVVYSGHVEVFAVRVEAGQAVGARRHLFGADAGAALLGMDLRGKHIGLLACGAPDTQLVRVKRSSLAKLAERPELAPMVAALIESWVDRLSSSLVRALPPRDCLQLEAGRERELPANGMARTRQGVLWVSHLQGSSRYLGRAELPAINTLGVIPLSPHAWLQATEPLRVSATETLAALEEQGAWAHLDRFHELALACLVADAEQRERAERERHDDRARSDRARLDAALARLAYVLAPRSRVWAGADGRDPLLAACWLVGDALGIAIKPPRAAPGGSAGAAPLRAIADASRVRTRRVALRGAWWKTESGPLVGYLEEGDRPVALLPVAAGYALHDPAARTTRRVTAAVAATLGPFADTFYRRFDDRPLTARDLLAFGLKGCRWDLLRIVLIGVAIGILATLTPIATGALFDLVIPGAHRPLLLQLGAGLAVAALASALFQVVREIAVLRLAGRMQAAIEAAIMNRLLELPAAFFRQYTAGDLGQRALGISTIQQVLTGVVLSAIFSSLFSLFSFAILFVYDLRLALVATGLVLVLVVAFAASSYLQVRYQRVLGARAGRVSGVVLQLINGVAKFRVAGAEARAFALWAGEFAAQRQLTYQARTVGNGMAVFNGIFPVLTSMALFAALALALEPKPPIGTFLAFNAAFGQFVTAALGLIQAFTAIYQVVPAYERARPILQALPEADESKADPGELSGAIEIDRVSFRYSAESPLILDDVSLECRPGEFVALVGPSGSGKSTLLRLLLGFETPEVGAILYDGRNLATLNVRAVRRQIGTVLQNGRLMSGDIFTNIVGASALTLDDAWEAARMAGLDADIREMPMGMHTVISEGGGTLSGGQRQRLMIARAIVNRPRLILFDEATSALDNRTQEIVSKSLESLAATRVVIAHRLSTVVNADRIYVFQRGRIVESGTYRELMQRRGVFAHLARRQIA